MEQDRSGPVFFWFAIRSAAQSGYGSRLWPTEDILWTALE